MRATSIAAVLSLLVANTAHAQRPARTDGPVIQGYGAVFAVPDPAFPTPAGALKVVFDVSETPEDASARNARIETVARFLNMHAQAGVPRERMEVALVVHGPAGKDLLADAHYRMRLGADNPNADLIAKLVGAGVQVVLCGQTAAARDLPREQLVPGVRIGLSAMTALVALQNQGYALIPW